MPRRRPMTIDCRSTRSVQPRPSCDSEVAGLTDAFMMSFNALVASGDRDGARMLLDRQIQHAYDLLDAAAEFERPPDKE